MAWCLSKEGTRLHAVYLVKHRDTLIFHILCTRICEIIHLHFDVNNVQEHKLKIV